MAINGIPNSHRAVTTISGPKVKASEEGCSNRLPPVSTRAPVILHQKFSTRTLK